MSVNALNEVTVQLTRMTCGKCSGVFALTETFRSHVYETKTGGWVCPYCKESWTYLGKTGEQKLLEQLQEKERQRAWHEARARDERAARERVGRQLSAQRGATKRIKNRVAHGVCPCCTRSFTNLRRHMDTKHPDYTAEKVA